MFELAVFRTQVTPASQVGWGHMIYMIHILFVFTERIVLYNVVCWGRGGRPRGQVVG